MEDEKFSRSIGGRLVRLPMRKTTSSGDHSSSSESSADGGTVEQAAVLVATNSDKASNAATMVSSTRINATPTTSASATEKVKAQHPKGEAASRKNGNKNDNVMEEETIIYNAPPVVSAPRTTGSLEPGVDEAAGLLVPEQIVGQELPPAELMFNTAATTIQQQRGSYERGVDHLHLQPEGGAVPSSGNEMWEMNPERKLSLSSPPAAPEEADHEHDLLPGAAAASAARGVSVSADSVLSRESSSSVLSEEGLTSGVITSSSTVVGLQESSSSTPRTTTAEDAARLEQERIAKLAKKEKAKRRRERQEAKHKEKALAETKKILHDPKTKQEIQEFTNGGELLYSFWL